ncbi:pleckstrin homology domain-containing family S member 1-like isoform X2 [Antennarius striatus]|uniref:pleckstrin homology domain-containing family S member 1-like isoform X2 n=1 Tax=Antennarius striatus TaxID=241820 RepID=UPI0035B12F4F
MQRSMRNPGLNTVFYNPSSSRKEVYSGYFVKSPPLKKFRTERSWKKRYFVLYKISEQEHQLHYFKSKEEMDRIYKKIELSDIKLLYTGPEKHEKWQWIQRTFKCTPTCVLYIKTKGRDFFLLGQKREEVDDLFTKLFNAMKKRPHKVMNPEDIWNGGVALETKSKSLAVKKSSTLEAEKVDPQDLKLRSHSDPYPNGVDNSNKKMVEDHNKRRASVPQPAIYDYPAPFYKKPVQEQRAENNRRKSLDSLYESMRDIADYSREDQDTGEEETSPTSELSSSSSENIATSPVEMSDTPTVRTLDKQSSTESLDNITPEERDIEVKTANLKKHLSITEMEGKPCVSGWTGQPQSVCLFHKGDQILAINDLHVGSLDEFNMSLSRSLKNEVKVTILRLHGCVPLHLPNCPCSDGK